MIPTHWQALAGITKYVLPSGLGIQAFDTNRISPKLGDIDKKRYFHIKSFTSIPFGGPIGVNSMTFSENLYLSISLSLVVFVPNALHGLCSEDLDR